MKYILSFCILFLHLMSVQAQQVYTITADSVKITNSSATGELILENHTKDVPGFLFNSGNGRTMFKKPLARVNDSTYLLGADTLKLKTNSGNYVQIDPSAAQTGSYNITGNGKVGGLFTINGWNVVANNDSKMNFIISRNNKSSLTSTGNTGVGSHIFDSLTTGNNNTGFGYGVMEYVSTGTSNTAFGAKAQNTLTTGNYNVALGVDAQRYLTSGQSNVALGYQSQYKLTSATNNVSMGTGSGGYITTETSNTFIGDHSGAFLQTGSYGNTAVGASSLIGDSATQNLLDYNSVAIGAYAGNYKKNTATVSRSQNIYIGYRAGYNDTGSQRLFIANDSNNIALWGNMSTHHYIFNPAAAPVDAGYTLDIQANNGVDGSFRAQGLITAAGNIKLTTSGSDTKGAIPIRDSLTGQFVNLAAGTEGQVLTISNNKPTWVTPATPDRTNNVVTVTASYTATAANAVIILNATSGTITLPAANTNIGRRFFIRVKGTSQTATIASAGGLLETSLGTYGTTATVSTISGISYISDGTYWLQAN